MINMKLSILGLGALGVLLLLLAGFVLLIVWLIGRGKQTQTAAPSTPLPVALGTEARREEREAVLQKLARKELTREEAESQLAELDNPVPDGLPSPRCPARRSRAGCGCVVAVLLFFLVLIGAAVGVFYSVKRAQVMAQEAKLIEVRRPLETQQRMMELEANTNQTGEQ